VNAFLSAMMVGVLVIAIVFVVAVVWAVMAFNGLVAARNRYRNAWSQIDIQLKRRYDLIPNLVEAVKAYMQHESGTLEAVIAARGRAQKASAVAAARPGDPGAVAGVVVAESALNRSMIELMATTEAYPELKANEQVAQLIEELGSTENRVSFARQAYNDCVMEFNNATEQFPTNIIAGMFSFTPAQLYNAIESDQERKAVRVNFG